MALFQVLKYDGPAHVLVWKHPKQDMNTGSRLVVGPSQEAVFVQGGRICDVLGSGTHVLDTNNLPILSGLLSLPFGRKSPFTAEVFFVNKLDILDIKWGTARHIQLRDPVYNIAVPLRAFGQYGVRVEDSGRFLERLVSTGQPYTTQELTGYFRGVVGSRIVDEIAGYLLREKLCFLEVSAHLTEISQGVAQSLEPFFAGYGIRLVNFCVTSINAPEGDPSVRRLREVLDRKHEMDALQYDYQQGRSFDVLEQAAQSMGGGEAAGIGVGAALGSVLAGMVKETVQPAPQSPGFCAGCGAALSPGDAFCSKCGRPAGGPAAHCAGCGAVLSPGSLFCPKCGRPVSSPVPGGSNRNM